MSYVEAPTRSMSLNCVYHKQEYLSIFPDSQTVDLTSSFLAEQYKVLKAENKDEKLKMFLIAICQNASNVSALGEAILLQQENKDPSQDETFLRILGILETGIETIALIADDDPDIINNQFVQMLMQSGDKQREVLSPDIAEFVDRVIKQTNEKRQNEIQMQQLAQAHYPSDFSSLN